jgi:hypothetical protein
VTDRSLKNAIEARLFVENQHNSEPMPPEVM